MKIYSITCYFVFLLSQLINGQINYNENTNVYSVAQPDVYNFEKYNLNPINYYTGKPIITVPIYTIKSGRIEYPINLVCDAGGIKVDQLASNVGLGWNLTSAILTRTINQDNDFDNTGSINLQSDFNTYSSEDKSADWEARLDYNTEGKIGYFLQKQFNIHINDQHRRVDFIPDVYHFYANGFSTSFFFNDENTPVEINPKGTKILAVKSKQRFDKKVENFHTAEYNLLTQDFFTIYIITKEGIKYTFSDCDIAFNQNLNVNGIPSGDFETIHPPAQVSAWHVTKIEDLNNDKEINFIYQNYYPNPNRSTQTLIESDFQRSFEFVSYPSYPCWNESCVGEICGYPIHHSNFGRYDLNITSRVDVVTKYLRKIVFEEGEINFKYSGDPDLENQQTGGARFDIYATEYLRDILIKNKNQDILKKFNFSYAYFESLSNGNEFNPDNFINPYRYKRLKLNSLTEIGKPSYKFYYNEDVKLPPVNSFSVDFLGYFNNTQDATNISTFTMKPAPTLYYYPNQFEKSLSPFPINSLTGYVFPGFFDRQASINVDDVKAWSLRKIEYPTGGFTEYLYELNDFEEFGQTIKGGGIRVAQQILNDGIGGIRILNYSYLKDNSSLTSGKLSSFPYFGHPTKKIFDVGIDWQSTPPIITTPTPVLNPSLSVSNTVFFFKIFGKSNLNADINSGSYVGYSRVIETEVGKGKKIFSFASNEDINFQNRILRLSPEVSPYIESPSVNNTNLNFCASNFIIANSGYGANIFTDNSYKRGKLTNEKVYNENDVLLNERNISYDDNQINSYSFYQPSTRLASTGSESDGNYKHLLTSRKDFLIARFLPSTETISTFDSYGNHIDENINYTYNSNGFLKTAETISSNGSANRIEYNYPTEVTTSVNSLPGSAMSLQENSMYRFMVTSKGNIAERIQTNHYKNNILNNYERKTYRIFNPTTNYGNVLSFEALQAAKGIEPLQNIIKTDRYDDNFNATQLTTKNESVVSIIYGYNKTKPIAKLEYVNYSSIPATTITDLQTKSNADIDASSELILRTALDNLRTTFPNAMITTYTYDPLIGVTSVTDPKGDRQTYTYDSFGRLLNVKDKDGNTLTENDYHYKP